MIFPNMCLDFFYSRFPNCLIMILIDVLKMEKNTVTGSI